MFHIFHTFALFLQLYFSKIYSTNGKRYIFLLLVHFAGYYLRLKTKKTFSFYLHMMHYFSKLFACATYDLDSKSMDCLLYFS